ncbi:MAG: hypothetical protein KAY37_08380 [Phycisphaerae bacterium]|nr:hypothetical protein [Phycisphaerae bacterium]
MNAERLKNECLAVHDELLRLTYGDVAEPSAGLSSHLARCPRCRETSEEAREVVEALRIALLPEPLPRRLEDDIRVRLDAEIARRPAVWSLPSRLICTAAAACLLAALLSPGQAPSIELSEADAAAIVAAQGLLRWEGSVESSVDDLTARVDDVARKIERVSDPGSFFPSGSVEYLSAKVDDIARTIERDPDAHTVLPWDPEDDWDVPAGEAETSGVRPRSVRVACGSANELSMNPIFGA